jgi:hypothetical protein
MLALALTLSLVDPAPEYVAAKRLRNTGAAMIVIGAVGGLVGIATGWSIAFRSLGDLDCELSSSAPDKTCPRHDYGADRSAAIATSMGGLAVALGGVAALAVGARRMKRLSLQVAPVASGAMAGFSLRF